MNSEKPACHGYRGARRKYDLRAEWEREKYRLLVLYRRELVEWLTEGKPLPRTPVRRGPDKQRRTRRKAAA